MLPFYKLFSLVIRVFARPLINYTRRYHISNQSSESSFLKGRFVRFGNLCHRVEMEINRRFLKMSSTYTHKPLNDESALEKGIEMFYEIMIYAILIGFSVFEMVVSTRDSANKKRLLDERLDNYKVSLAVMEENVKKINHNFEAIVEQQKSRIRDLESQLHSRKQLLPMERKDQNTNTATLEPLEKSPYLKAFELLGKRFSVREVTRGPFDYANQLLYPF